jgi:hypothetical protein
MLAGLIFKNPLLWCSTTLGAMFGLVMDHDQGPLSIPLKIVFSVLAFFGALIGQLLSFYLRSRQQRQAADEKSADRMERVLKDQRGDHQKQVEQYLKRINDLERRLERQK